MTTIDDHGRPEPPLAGDELANLQGFLDYQRATLAWKCAGLDAAGLQAVLYVGIFPNVLVSLHPDYVMVHRLIPVAPDRTKIECTWAFAPEALARPGFDPGYASEFWDITNRQDWSACESVQRGLASPVAAPGPLAPDEDAVYSFVTTVARGYLGERIGEWRATHAQAAAPAE